MPINLKAKVQWLKGVGPIVSKKLNGLGINTVSDILCYFPRAYDDRRNLKLLKATKENERATFRFKIIEHSTFFYHGKNHPKIKVRDESGTAWLYCFNRDYIKNKLQIGRNFFLTGSYKKRNGIPIFSRFDITDDNKSVDLKILPVYSLTSGIHQKTLRKIVVNAFDECGSQLGEDIPEFIRRGYKFEKKVDILKEIHYPEAMDSLRRAKEAFTYEEFFKYQVVIALTRKATTQIKKIRSIVKGNLKNDFLKGLSFSLTHAQIRVLNEIESDLKSKSPMSRLIQGDVGSGKTVVALIAALYAVESGGQIALMAPTEILARQHFNKITEYLKNLPVNIEFISGSVKGIKRKEIVLRLLKGEIAIVVGTHALFSDDIYFKNLSLVVIDEQHKFGVLQRGNLRAKGDNPDCIVMSATPIPRTLSMTLYGDLDVSIIDELPPGRKEVETQIVKQAEISKVYSKVREELSKGRQAYFVYPLIEDSKGSDLKNAKESYEWLKKDAFKGFNVGLLHGKMNDIEKDKKMLKFKNHEYDILVSTTVVEVGMDVSNATIMVIEHAERFGLSSIHQLRGRIGRGSAKSYCFLVPSRNTGRDSFKRLMLLKDTHDGFKIAEWDLKLRGPGDMIGKKQSGIPSFIIDNLDINTRLIYRAQKDARRFINEEIGTKEERDDYINSFIKSESYTNALMYFGG